MGKFSYYCVYGWCWCEIKSIVQRKKFLNKNRDGKFLKQKYLFLGRSIIETNWQTQSQFFFSMDIRGEGNLISLYQQQFPYQITLIIFQALRVNAVVRFFIYRFQLFIDYIENLHGIECKRQNNSLQGIKGTMQLLLNTSFFVFICGFIIV